MHDADGKDVYSFFSTRQWRIFASRGQCTLQAYHYVQIQNDMPVSAAPISDLLQVVHGCTTSVWTHSNVSTAGGIPASKPLEKQNVGRFTRQHIIVMCL